MADNLTTQRQLSEKNSWFGHEWGGSECKICSWSLICLSISRFIPSGLSLVSFLSNWFFIIIIIIIFQLKSWYSPTQSTWKPIQTYSLAGKIQGLWQLHTSMQCVNLVSNKWFVWYFGMWHIFTLLRDTWFLYNPKPCPNCIYAAQYQIYIKSTSIYHIV